MIADYLYNTPAPPAGSTVAVVLFATAYEDSESLNAVVQGKTLAEIVANSNTLAAGESKKTPVTFGGSGKRKKTSLYGRTYAPEFEFPTSVDFTVHRNGIARAVFFGLIVGGKIVRGIHMTVALADAEAKASRASFSVDDDPHTSKIKSPGPTGSMIDNMEAVLHISAPLSAASQTGALITATLTVRAPDSVATITTPVSNAVLLVVPASPSPTAQVIDPRTILRNWEYEGITAKSRIGDQGYSLTNLETSTALMCSVVGKPRLGNHMLRVKFSGTGTSYCAIVPLSSYSLAGRITWRDGLAVNTWHTVRVEVDANDMRSVFVNNTLLYTGANVIDLGFYVKDGINKVEFDTGQLGSALLAGYGWL